MKVLVPMDFSEVSMNGFNYALARFSEASLTILHVMSGILEINQAYHIQPGVTHEVQASNHLENMILQNLGTEELPPNIKIEVYYGEPTNVIYKYLEDHAFDAVVAGSRDKYDFFDKIFGTTSLGIVKKCKEPIYIIPRYAKYKGYEKIMVASDEQINDPEIILALNYWNSVNAQIKFLHVGQNDHDNFEKTKETLLKTLYEEYQPPFSYEIEQVRGKHVVDSLLANAYNYKADLLIVIARNSSFVHSLVYKSVSKELIMKSAIPVLFLHAKKSNSK